MKKDAMVGKIGGNGMVEVELETAGRLNKYGRVKVDGKRVPCPFTGIRKHSKMVIDLNAKYVGEEEDDNNCIVESYTKSTDIPYIKESVKTPGKYYLWGKLVKSTSEWKDAKGAKIDRKELADYLPKRKSSDVEPREIWLKISLDNIKSVK